MALTVGDTTLLTLDVAPSDATTSVAAQVTAPDGTVSTPVTTGTADGSHWTASLTVTQPGVWRIVWTVTGTGAGVQPQSLTVAPLPEAPPGRAYVTLAGLHSHLGYLPDNAARQVVRASRLVDGLLVGAVYATDQAGMPNDTEVADALAEAVAAQVDYWAQGHADPSGAAAGYDTVAIGSARLSKSSSSTQQAGTVTVNGIPVAPEATTALHLAGLLPVQPIVR